MAGGAAMDRHQLVRARSQRSTALQMRLRPSSPVYPGLGGAEELNPLLLRPRTRRRTNRARCDAPTEASDLRPHPCTTAPRRGHASRPGRAGVGSRLGPGEARSEVPGAGALPAALHEGVVPCSRSHTAVKAHFDAPN
jgi:hypothetical protein